MINQRFIFALLVSSSLSLYARAGGPVKDSLAVDASDTNAVIQADDPILASMDSLLTDKYLAFSNFTTDTSCLNVHGFKPGEIPDYPDSVIAARIHQLDMRSPFHLIYNQYVDAFINLYTKQKRELTSRILGLSQLYNPMIEQKLDEFNIPLEMKYLAVVESALNPRARSRAGAKGLWQFMYSTGKMYDLDVNSYIDERYDPIQSTVAACRYFKFLYSLYGDWNLVLAAYNSGPGNVNKAIRRSGGKKDYWAIRPFLPRETRGYIPAFIAVNYVMNYAADHNLYPIQPMAQHAEIDTLHIHKPMKFARASEFTGVSSDELMALNPSCKTPYVPPMNHSFTLYLPRESVGKFMANEDSIFYFPVENLKEIKQLIAQQTLQYHIVRRGEVLGSIAGRYHVSVQQLKEWNNLRGYRIYQGQKLVVYAAETTARVSHHTAHKTASVPHHQQIAKDGHYEYYTVQPGDTLWDIAKKFDGVSMSDIKALNSNIDYRRLKPGQRIKIATSGT